MTTNRICSLIGLKTNDKHFTGLHASSNKLVLSPLSHPSPNIKNCFTFYQSQKMLSMFAQKHYECFQSQKQLYNHKCLFIHPSVCLSSKPLKQLKINLLLSFSACFWDTLCLVLHCINCLLIVTSFIIYCPCSMNTLNLSEREFC